MTKNRNLEEKTNISFFLSKPMKRVRKLFGDSIEPYFVVSSSYYKTERSISKFSPDHFMHRPYRQRGPNYSPYSKR